MNPRQFVLGLLVYGALVAIAPAEGIVVLYERASAFNTIVVTQEQDGRRTLRFGRDGARQSVVRPGDPDHLALPHLRVALVGLALSEAHRRFLVIGLGGGTLPMFLRKYYPSARIDTVDIDPDVVDVAKKFFGFIEDERMSAHADDGREFIEKVREPYDVVILDAFGSRSIPEHLTTQEFLQGVRRAVAWGGVVIGNLWGRSYNALYDSMVRTYQEVFDELYILDVRGSGNRILVALPRSRPLTRAELMHLASTLSSSRRFPFDLADPDRYGFLNAKTKNEHGHVLRDRASDRRQ